MIDLAGPLWIALHSIVRINVLAINVCDLVNGILANVQLTVVRRLVLKGLVLRAARDARLLKVL